ncbi:MAG TPA: PAS domain S-box protein, partial [Candidatus Thermoplasmatota archaeon]|nr:PAS domain S-box protein [Candidatus Thermoplasmatota archaeon]
RGGGRDAAASTPAEAAWLRDRAIEGLLCVPIPGRSGLLGVVTLGAASGARPLDTQDIDLARELARRMGVAIENARLVADLEASRHETEERARELADLKSLTDVALSPLPLPQLLSGIVERARTLMRADTCAVLLVEGDELVVRAASGIPEEVGFRIPWGAGFAGRIAAEQRPSEIEEAKVAEAFHPRLRAAGVRSLFGVPLVAGGKVVGVLAVGSKSERRFREHERELLQTAALRVAVSIDRERLLEAERQARGRAEEYAQRLQESEDLFRLLADHTSDLLLLLDPQGLVFYASPSALRVLGYEADQLLGHDLFAYVHEDDLPASRKAFERATTGETVEFTARIRTADGQHRWIENRGRRIHRRGGPVFVTTLRDVSERVRAQEEAARRAAQQAAVARLGSAALGGEALESLFDRAVRFLADHLGVEYAKVLELRPDRSGVLLRAGVGWRSGLVGHAIVPVGRDSQAGYTLLSDAPVVVEDLRTEPRFRGPALLREHGVVSGLSCVIRGASGDPWGVLGAHTKERRSFTRDDVSFLQSVANVLAQAIERGRAERELRASEARYRTLVDHAQDFGLLTLSPEGLVRSWSSGAQRLFGWEAAEILDRPAAILFGRAAREAGLPAAELEAALREGRFAGEVALVRKDGSRFLANCTIRPVRENGAVTGFVKVVQDLTEARRAQRALSESEERYRRVVESARDFAILAIDARGTITSWNTGAQRVFGYAPEEILGRPSDVLFPPEARARGAAQDELARARAHGEASDDTWMLRKDGTRFWATGVTSLVRAADASASGYVKICRDRSEHHNWDAERERLLGEAAATRERLDAALADLARLSQAAEAGRTPEHDPRHPPR